MDDKIKEKRVESFRDEPKPRGFLGDNLTFFRRKVGLTQQQVADALCLNRTTYTKYETGITEPNVIILKKLAQLFGVDVNSLLSDSDDAFSFADSDSSDDSEKKLVDIFEKLDNDKKEALIEYAEKLNT